jgi:hypothetical protein
MAQYIMATRQERVLIQGGITEGDFFWIIDASGNRVAICWRRETAEQMTDALDVVEEIDRMCR